MKSHVIRLLFSFSLFFYLNAYAVCNKVVVFIEDLVAAQEQCVPMCRNSGGWTGQWLCKHVGHCTCSCKGPCVYTQERQKPDAKK